MFAESPDNLTLELGASRTLTTVFAVIHGGAGALALILPLAIGVRGALFVLIGLSFYRSARRHGLRRARDAIEALMLDTDGECALRRRGSGEWEPSRLVNWWTQRWLAIVVIRRDGYRWAESVVICADAVSVEGFRRLRVRLRLRAEREPGSYRDPRSADRKKDSPE